MTVHVHAIGGAPATGKSTLVQRTLAHYGAFKRFDWGTCKGRIYDDTPLIVLGRYGPDRDFGGTDALAMNAIVDTKDFLDSAAESDEHENHTVLLEGDRLFNESFLDYCDDHWSIDLTAWCLTADETALEARHVERGDDQSDSWLEGRKTKYENLRAIEHLPIETRGNSGMAALEANTDALLDLLPTPASSTQQ